MVEYIAHVFQGTCTFEFIYEASGVAYELGEVGNAAVGQILWTCPPHLPGGPGAAETEFVGKEEVVLPYFGDVWCFLGCGWREEAGLPEKQGLACREVVTVFHEEVQGEAAGKLLERLAV